LTLDVQIRGYEHGTKDEVQKMKNERMVIFPPTCEERDHRSVLEESIQGKILGGRVYMY
jgi:hypothetical protein